MTVTHFTPLETIHLMLIYLCVARNAYEGLIALGRVLAGFEDGY